MILIIWYILYNLMTFPPLGYWIQCCMITAPLTFKHFRPYTSPSYSDSACTMEGSALEPSWNSCRVNLPSAFWNKNTGEDIVQRNSISIADQAAFTLSYQQGAKVFLKQILSEVPEPVLHGLADLVQCTWMVSSLPSAHINDWVLLLCSEANPIGWFWHRVLNWQTHPSWFYLISH